LFLLLVFLELYHLDDEKKFAIGLKVEKYFSDLATLRTLPTIISLIHLNIIGSPY